MTQFPHLLELARLQSRKGDLFEARATAEEGLQAFSKENQPESWLESARIYFQCCAELDEVPAAQPVMEEVVQLLAKYLKSESHQAQAETLISSWLLALGKRDESVAYVNSAIVKATHSRDLDTLARVLLVNAFTLCLEPKNLGQALLQLEKIDLLLPEINNPEIEFTAKTLRGFIYIEKNQLDLAMGVLWKNYEQAKLHGFHLSIAGVLAQIARLYKLQKQEELFKLYAKLALTGLSRTKAPRLYKSVIAVCPEDFNSLTPKYDFYVNEEARLVQEKDKGPIDFKNQHILFDLALLFIKNPGQRYSKEDLVEAIWKQIYDPELHDNLIYVSIKRLRTLLEPDMESPRYILRDRKGYYLNPQSVIQHKNSEETIL